MNKLAIVTDGGGGGSSGITNPVLGNLGKMSGQAFLQKALPSAVGLTFLIGVLIFLFQMLLGGIGWISSGGDKQALETARGKITNAIIGLIVLFATLAIIQVVEAFFKINILTIDIGPLKIS